MARDDKPVTIVDYLVRGILAGGGLGVVVSWIVATMDMRRGLFLGMLCGALAGLTLFHRKNR